ncbi:hypothetical protein H9P43_003951 [Blastocladiella emersonii ATCC 22665]|nr:hypothetical protein H9P43_003951 [Blastocladiella emersonii ATCC 22665]
MPDRSVCVGITYETDAAPLPGCEADAMIMGGISERMSIEDVRPMTGEVTRQEILDALTEMVAQAEPGDNLMFSFSGHGGQMPDPTNSEADGMAEFIATSDGAITDAEIREILAGLPEGSNMTIALDSCRSGGVLEFNDLMGDDIAGNVVAISASQMDENASAGFGDGPSPFTQALDTVLVENPGISWNDALQEINAIDGAQTPSLAYNRPEAAFAPAFAPVDFDEVNPASDNLVDATGLEPGFEDEVDPDAAVDEISADLETLEVEDAAEFEEGAEFEEAIPLDEVTEFDEFGFPVEEVDTGCDDVGF